MKNLFLVLAFMLIGTFAFANNTSVTTEASSVETIAIHAMTNQVVLDDGETDEVYYIYDESGEIIAMGHHHHHHHHHYHHHHHHH